jgi:hypothetical protein
MLGSRPEGCTAADIRAGLAVNLAVISGIQVSAYALANPTPPCVEIVKTTRSSPMASAWRPRKSTRSRLSAAALPCAG